MKISLNWLKEFVDIPKDKNAKYLAELFTIKTAEVENFYGESEIWKNIYVGQVLEIKPHPNANKLRLAKVTLGKKTLNIVCGGSNLYEGMYVAAAIPGAMIKWHGEEEFTELKPAEIRGVKSEGMICAGEEMGLIADENLKQPSGGILDLTAIKPIVGKPLAETLKRTDTIFEIENKSLTHRPDLWGHYGIAREFASILDKKLKPFKISVKIPAKGKTMKISVKNKRLCPRYCGVIIENIEVAPSPSWITEKLKAVGRGAHNNIVDVTNYVTEELGQPLHAFDINNIDSEIIVRNAQEKEKFIALDNKERALSSDMLVIADKNKPLAIAGVIGGINSGITKNTKTIFIESANFDAASVRKTSIKLGLRTDSVQRFEKALDPNLAELGIKRACELILKVCPNAKISGPIVDIKNFDQKPIKIDLNLSRIESKIGVKIPVQEIIKILEKLEFKVAKKDKNILSITVPSFRATKDIDIEEDLIEEISRMHGYDKIPSALPELPTKLPIENFERELKYKARNILSLGLGFTETQSYSFYGEKEISSSRLPEELHLKLENYLSEDQTHLRISLIPNMLKNLQQNIKSFDSFKIYEIGRTYIDGKEYFPVEEKYICGMIISNKKSEKEIFYSAKGALEAFFTSFGAPELQAKKETSRHFYVNPSKCVIYRTIDNEEIAKVFEIHPAVLRNFDLEEVNIGCFEVNFSKLVKLGTITKTYAPVPKFPEIKFDISVIMPKEKTVEEVQKIIKNSDKNIIDVELFDIFIDKSIGEKSRALAFSIALRSDEKTLTTEDMARARKEIFKQLKHAGGKIRGL